MIYCLQVIIMKKQIGSLALQRFQSSGIRNFISTVLRPGRVYAIVFDNELHAKEFSMTISGERSTAGGQLIADGTPIDLLKPDQRPVCSVGPWNECRGMRNAVSALRHVMRNLSKSDANMLLDIAGYTASRRTPLFLIRNQDNAMAWHRALSMISEETVITAYGPQPEKVLSRWRQDGRITLISCTDLGDVASWADELLIVEHEQFIGMGTPSQLALRPLSAATAAVLSTGSWLDASICGDSKARTAVMCKGLVINCNEVRRLEPGHHAKLFIPHEAVSTADTSQHDNRFLVTSEDLGQTHLLRMING